VKAVIFSPLAKSGKVHLYCPFLLALNGNRKLLRRVTGLRTELLPLKHLTIIRLKSELQMLLFFG
jgi:hypothetical protein